MPYTFGKRSSDNLKTCHPDLVKIANLAIQWSPTDFGIHAGERTIEMQQEYFRDGKSKINPQDYTETDLMEKAKHVVSKDPNSKYALSRAFDFHCSETMPGKDLTWDITHMAVVIGVIMAAAQYLFDKGEVCYQIRSGGDWDRDGIYIYDHQFQDLPHIELINY